MYGMGIPLGLLIDTKGHRPSVLIGVFMLAAGYFPLHQAYNQGSAPFGLLCLFSWMTGLGGCAAFNASIKASALNWPHHRGKATGFPLAAFGLSAFFFSAIGQILVPGSTGNFLMLLACGTSGIVAISFFFLRVVPQPQYSSVGGQRQSKANPLYRTRSEEQRQSRTRHGYNEPGRSASIDTIPEEADIQDQVAAERSEVDLERSSSETSSLLTNDSIVDQSLTEDDIKDRAHRVDIRGFQMLQTSEFWHLFVILGCMSGVGLMTIK